MTPSRTPSLPRKAAARAPVACQTKDAIGRELDAELDQSFPASDPPSIVRDAPVACGEAASKATPKAARKPR